MSQNLCAKEEKHKEEEHTVFQRILPENGGKERYKKVNQSRYRPGVAQRVPGS
jgi:hypothetical protein